MCVCVCACVCVRVWGVDIMESRGLPEYMNAQADSRQSTVSPCASITFGSLCIDSMPEKECNKV